MLKTMNKKFLTYFIHLIQSLIFKNIFVFAKMMLSEIANIDRGETDEEI